MMISPPTLIQADRKISRVVTCSITDRLLEQLPTSVIFFYKEKLPLEPLITALRKVLVDFPLFSGRLKIVNDDLLIDCSNEGVRFSRCFDDDSLARILADKSQTKFETLIDPLVVEDVLKSQSPPLTIRLTQFDCGGTALGICCHHSVGDMHTFMHFMRAWSAATNDKQYDLPLIVEDRDAYLQKQLAENASAPPNVRYLVVSQRSVGILV